MATLTRKSFFPPGLSQFAPPDEEAPEAPGQTAAGPAMPARPMQPFVVGDPSSSPQQFNPVVGDQPDQPEQPQQQPQPQPEQKTWDTVQASMPENQSQSGQEPKSWDSVQSSMTENDPTQQPKTWDSVQSTMPENAPSQTSQPTGDTGSTATPSTIQPSAYQKWTGQGPRPIQGIILHSSDGSMKGDLNTLSGNDPNHQVSAHYYTDKQGNVHNLVGENDIAYHAGKTTRLGLNNSNTIGIEQEHVDGQPWDDAEVRGTAKQVANILQRHPELSIANVVGHSDVAPERKQDPLNFPWDQFRQYVAQYMGQDPQIAAATNVQSKGGPPTSQLSASIGNGEKIGGWTLGSFGYVGDATPDANSLQGIGAYNQHMAGADAPQNGIISVGLSTGAQQKHGLSKGSIFKVGDYTFRVDDTNNNPGQEDYIDVYNPSHPPDKGHEDAANQKIGDTGKTQGELFAQRTAGEAGGEPTAPAAPTTGQTAAAPTTQPDQGTSDDDAFSKMVAKATNVPSKGGPSPENLQASTQQGPPQDYQLEQQPEENVYTPVTAFAQTPAQQIQQESMLKTRGQPKTTDEDEGETSDSGTNTVQALLDQYKAAPTQTGKAAALKQALQLHSQNPLLDPYAVQYDPATNKTKGEFFNPNDPVHQTLQSGMSDRDNDILDTASQAIQQKQPMHMSYVSAPSEGEVTGTGRAAAYQLSPAQSRALGSSEGQLTGQSLIPTSIGVSVGKKAGEPNTGYFEGVSTSNIAANAQRYNDVLGNTTPYPELNGSKFRNDFAGYVRNINNGYYGDGSGPIQGTKDVPAISTEGYTPHKLTAREADYMNAIQHNVRHGAETSRIVSEFRAAQGHDPESEINPLREEAFAKDPTLAKRLESSVRAYRAELVDQMHQYPDRMAKEIRPPDGTGAIQDAFLKHGIPQKELVAAHAMPGKKIKPTASRTMAKAEPRAPSKSVYVGEPPGPGEKLTKPKGKAAKLSKAPGPGEKIPAKEVSKAIIKRIGPRPTNPQQAVLWDRVAGRIEKEIEGAVPIVPAKNEKGEFKHENGEPLYETHAYDLANAPMLGKKALGYEGVDKSGNPIMRRAPKDTEDTLGGEFKYLGDVDRKRLSHLKATGAVDAYADKLSEEFKKIKDVPEVMAGKGWYSEVRKWLDDYLGPHAQLFANLLAATSPNEGVVQNFKNALHAYDKFRRGDFDKHIKLYREAYRHLDAGTLVQHIKDSGIGDELIKKGAIKELPTTEAKAMAAWIHHHGIKPVKDNGKLFGMHSDAVLRVLASTWEHELEGPKTGNFSGNLGGKTLESTIDMWAARTMRRLGYEGHTKGKPWLLHPPQEEGVSDLDFALSQLAFRKAAKDNGLTPDDLQAILWYSEQIHWNDKGYQKSDVGKKDYRPLLQMLKDLPHPKPTKAHEWEDMPSLGQSEKAKKAARKLAKQAA